MARFNRILSILALAAACAQPDMLHAQTPTRAEMDSVKRGLGSTTKVYTRAEPCPYVLANGEYDVFCRQRKLNFTIDDLVQENIALRQSNLDLKQQLDAILVRVVALEARPTNTGSVVVAPNGGTLTVDKVIAKKICVVDGTYATDCDPDKQEQIQCRGANGCAIGFNANLNNAWRQEDTPNGTGPGYAMFGMSPDLGLRACQNQAWAYSGYKDYLIAKGKGCWGMDSQANFSIQQCEYGVPCKPGQSVVMLASPIGWTWTAWQTGRPVCLRGSISVYGAADSAPVCTPQVQGAARPRGSSLPKADYSLTPGYLRW